MKILYEINTRAWIRELSSKYKTNINLGDIPEIELNYIKDIGFDSIWLMGVWQQSEVGKIVARSDRNVMEECQKYLDDLREEDLCCSPYCVVSYNVDKSLGTNYDLINLKRKLNGINIKLILDFVPNHLALDNPFINTDPEIFIRGTRMDVSDYPQIYFINRKGEVFAHGKIHIFLLGLM